MKIALQETQENREYLAKVDDEERVSGINVI